MKTIAPYFDGTQLCAQTDPELFFPSSPVLTVKHKRLTQPICNACHFKSECLEYALTTDVSGIWANTSDNDRRLLRRKRGLPAPSTVGSLITKLVS